MLEGTSSLNNRTVVIYTHCRCGSGCIIVSLCAEFSSVLQVWSAFESDDLFGNNLNFGHQMKDFLITLDVLFVFVGRCTRPSVARNLRNARKFGHSHFAEVLLVDVSMS